jgi:hypothetical protein
MRVAVFSRVPRIRPAHEKLLFSSTCVLEKSSSGLDFRASELLILAEDYSCIAATPC